MLRPSDAGTPAARTLQFLEDIELTSIDSLTVDSAMDYADIKAFVEAGRPLFVVRRKATAASAVGKSRAGGDPPAGSRQSGTSVAVTTELQKPPVQSHHQRHTFASRPEWRDLCASLTSSTSPLVGTYPPTLQEASEAWVDAGRLPLKPSHRREALLNAALRRGLLTSKQRQSLHDDGDASASFLISGGPTDLPISATGRLDLYSDAELLAANSVENNHPECVDATVIGQQPAMAAGMAAGSTFALRSLASSLSVSLIALQSHGYFADRAALFGRPNTALEGALRSRSEALSVSNATVSAGGADGDGSTPAATVGRKSSVTTPSAVGAGAASTRGSVHLDEHHIQPFDPRTFRVDDLARPVTGTAAGFIRSTTTANDNGGGTALSSGERRSSLGSGQSGQGGLPRLASYEPDAPHALLFEWERKHERLVVAARKRQQRIGFERNVISGGVGSSATATSASPHTSPHHHHASSMLSSAAVASADGVNTHHTEGSGVPIRGNAGAVPPAGHATSLNSLRPAAAAGSTTPSLNATLGQVWTSVRGIVFRIRFDRCSPGQALYYRAVVAPLFSGRDITRELAAMVAPADATLAHPMSRLGPSGSHEIASGASVAGGIAITKCGDEAALTSSQKDRDDWAWLLMRRSHASVEDGDGDGGVNLLPPPHDAATVFGPLAAAKGRLVLTLSLDAWRHVDRVLLLFLQHFDVVGELEDPAWVYW